MHNVVLDMATKDVKVMGSVPLAVHEHVTQAGLIQSQLRQILELTPSESL
jgi:predicted XRE-type DNA-binding protein